MPLVWAVWRLNFGTYIVVISGLGVLLNIDLGEYNWASFFSQLLGPLLPLRSKGLAVRAPRGVELNEKVLSVADGLSQVLVGENSNSLLLLRSSLGLFSDDC